MTQEQQLETKRTQYLIFGYINELSEKLKLINIPLDIIRTCLQFYHLRDYFTIHGDRILVNKCKNIANGTNIEETAANTVYGHEIIDLDDETIEKYIWRLHVYELICHDGFYIGICDINKLQPNKGQLSYRWNSIYFNMHQSPFVYNLRGSYVTLSLETKKIWTWNKHKKTKELVRKHVLSVNGGKTRQGIIEVKRERGTKYIVWVSLYQMLSREWIL